MGAIQTENDHLMIKKIIIIISHFFRHRMLYSLCIMSSARLRQIKQKPLHVFGKKEMF